MKVFSLLTLPVLLISASQWVSHSKQTEFFSDDSGLLHQGHSHEHEYRSPGKPGSAVASLQQSHFMSDTLAPQKVSLQLQSGLSEGELIVEVVGDDGIVLTGVESAFTFTLGEQPLPVIELEARADALGRYHVHIVATHLVDGAPVQARALAAELQFGADLPDKLFAKTAGQASANVVVLPSVETIR